MSDSIKQLTYASFWWRLLASFIDGILLGITGYILGVVACIVFQLMLIPFALPPKISAAIIILFSLLFGIIFRWLYFAFLESSSWKATLGKKVCNLTVVDLDGNPISFLRATGRYFGKYISGVLCCAGYIMAAFTERKQALHDKMASTLVLREVE